MKPSPLPHFALRRWLPRAIRSPLFGDRERFGPMPVRDDPDWIEWQDLYGAAYEATQRSGVGRTVNDAGYRVMESLPLAGQQVLEIGPGSLPHQPWWSGTPQRFTLVDTRRDMLEASASRLRTLAVPHAAVVVAPGSQLPFQDAAFDAVLSFYSLEHLYPLRDYLDEIERVLKPSGLLVGAIPLEGGIAWGAGRLLTSGRWFKRHTRLNHGKIICWEHPNFADQVLSALDRQFARQSLHYWPLRVPWLDINLVATFIYRKCERP